MVHTVLIVEDDKGLQKYLKELLLDNGYSVKIASDGIEALETLTKTQPDVMVLDLGLPNMSGEAVCAEVRKKYPELPVIILTAKDSIDDIVQGLNLGADDYMTKPFVADEFLARIKARLRRQDGGSESILTVADLSLNSKTLEVTRGEKQIQLTPQEFKLLQYLMNNKGRILTREMILNRIWLYSSDIETRVVDVYMGYLRKKIDTGFEKKLLHSVRGFGYVIKEYFANYFLHRSDVTFHMQDNRMEVHQRYAEPWRVTLVDTGEHTLTGGRLKRIASYLKNEELFCFTYGDGVGNINIQEKIQFHRSHGKLATVTTVQPPGRYGALDLGEKDIVNGFIEKPKGDEGWINGGFFVLSPKVIDFIKGDDTVWEAEPLTTLADYGQLMAYRHHGFWQPMDTLRDKNHLEELWSTGNAPWLITNKLAASA